MKPPIVPPVVTQAATASPSSNDGTTSPAPIANQENSERLDPASVLDAIVSAIRRYVVMDPEQADAAALWIVMTWFIHVIQVAPLALITAPERSCGKSQLLTIFDHLVARALSVANCTASFIFRTIERDCPTLLIDEADTFLRENAELKGIINAGHTRSQAYVGRTESDGKGQLEPKRFNVWCAKAFAGISLERHLPPATMSRSIVVTLRRKRPDESVQRLRHADPALFKEIASKLEQFARSYSDQVRAARPELPDELGDRAQDNWEPLFAIAECAGTDWIARARAAALKLSKSDEESVGTGTELLKDIADIFGTTKCSRIRTSDLIGYLLSNEDAPWATYNRGKPITPRQISTLLRGFGITSKTVRLGPHDTPKGFERTQFDDAFARYVDPSMASTEKGREVSPESASPLPDDIY